MRVLLDENLPRDLAQHIDGHAVSTVAGRGWAGTLNGELLKLASTEFDVFVTMDQRLPDQQRVAVLPLGIILLVAPSSRLTHLLPLLPELLRCIDTLEPGSVRTVSK